MSFVNFECNGKATIAGRKVGGSFKILITQKIGITFGVKEGISLYLLDKGFSEILRNGNSELNYDEGNLGIYHHTKDIREGPYVNHKFSNVKLNKIETDYGCILKVICNADYKESNYNSDYKGEKAGTFTASIELSILEADLDSMAEHMHNQALNRTS